MYETIFNQNTLIREWLNGSLVPLTINLTLVIGVYITQCFYESRRDGTKFRNTPGIQTACVLFWVFAAESIRASCTWFALRSMNTGIAISNAVSDVSAVLLITAAAVMIAAFLRCTYLFTPPFVRNLLWTYSLATTVIFIVLAQMFPEYPQMLFN